MEHPLSRDQTLLAQLQRLYRLQQNLYPRILDGGICNASGFLPQGPSTFNHEEAREYHLRFLLRFYQKAEEVLDTLADQLPRK